MGKKKSLVGWQSKNARLPYWDYDFQSTDCGKVVRFGEIFSNKKNLTKPIKVRITIEEIDQPKKAR